MVSKFLKALELDPNQPATPEDLKKAWKKQCLKHHPDHGGNPEMFRVVTHAYKMLTDPSYRREEEQAQTDKKGDLNIRFQVPVSFEDAFFGKTVVMTFNRIEFDENYKPVIKEVQEVLTFKIDLPQGCCDGHEVVKQAAGAKCKTEFGDLFIRFIPAKHPRFRLEGADVITEELVPLDIMLKGGEIEVQTMWGLKTAKVKPGMQPGQRITIDHSGVGEFGKHFAVVKPLFPDQATLKSEAWKGLDINWNIVEEVDKQAQEFETIFINLGGGVHVRFNQGNP